MNLEFSLWFCLGMAVVYVIVALVFLWKMIRGRENKYFCLFIFVTFMLGSFFCVAKGMNVCGKISRMDNVTECIKNGYEVYVDGVLADGTKLDMENYTFTIDDEKSEIYLTPKN